jgi:GntR family transcriptional regulator
VQPAITRDSALPLHVQFRDHLLGQIERGELRPGEQLVTERELAAEWGVSLAPVRQAMLDLVKEGYLHRVRGRGTFVSGATKVEQKIALLDSFSESMRAQGLEPDLRILRLELAPAPAGIRRDLKVRATRQILLERLALVENDPVAVLTSWLPAPRFAGLTNEALDGGSLYGLLGRKWGVAVTRATSVIDVVRCNADQAQLLGVERAAPALRVVGVTFDQDDKPIEHSDVLYRADRFRFALESMRQGPTVTNVVRRPSGDARNEQGALNG